MVEFYPFRKVQCKLLWGGQKNERGLCKTSDFSQSRMLGVSDFKTGAYKQYLRILKSPENFWEEFGQKHSFAKFSEKISE